VTEDERQALMDRNLAAARARVEAADDADRAPEAVNVSRLTPTVISPACNCDGMIVARETIARQKRVLAAQFGLDDDVPFSDIVASIRAQWHLDQETIARLTKERDEREAAHMANHAHGPRGSK